MWVPHRRQGPFVVLLLFWHGWWLGSHHDGIRWMWVWTWLMSMCKSHDSGICQQTGTTTVQKGIRCLRKTWSALYAWPCSSSQPFSNPFLSTWFTRSRVGEQRQCLSNSPAQEAQEGQREPLAVAGGERDTQERCEHVSGWNIYAPPGQDRLLHPPAQGQHFRLNRRPGIVSS